MKFQRNCKVCETPFTAIKVTQYFCTRKCFKRDYYLRNKDKMQAAHALPTFPTKSCAFCQTMQMIPYDPIKYPQRFSTWECTSCGVTNLLLWKYQDNPRSYQIIENLLRSVQVHSFLLGQPQEITVRASFITIISNSSVHPETRHEVVQEEKPAMQMKRCYPTTVIA